MMTTNKKSTLAEFAYKYMDGLYTPQMPFDSQCSGYYALHQMVVNSIEPASKEETERWENNPTEKELLESPPLRYMRAFHPLLRDFVRTNWNIIKDLEVE